MALYLLDKNVVEDIKKSLNGTPTQGVVKARSVDRKGCTVSPLLSILEGSIRRAQSGPEVYEQLVVDTQAVSMFYRLARTDSEFLRSQGASMVTALAPHMREKSNRLIPLAIELQALLVLQRNLVAARQVLQQIDELAIKHEVDLAHPLVTCAISCLYGSRPARGVLKPTVNPTEESAYNAVADIRLVMETAYVRHVRNEGGARESVSLLTGDKNLAALAKMLRVRVDTTFAADVNGPEIVSFNSTFSQELLPSLARDEGEMTRVMKRLKSSRDNTGKVIHP